MIIKKLLYIITNVIQISAHMFMKEPISRNSKYSEYYTQMGLVNYNLNSPLNVAPDYFKFPCKGFKKGPVITEINNNIVKATLEGTATHEGGHCQFGITYNERDFLVIRTIYNNCLIDTTSYEIELPINIPKGETTFFWTWINKIGNREYYMECADIYINNNNQNYNTELSGLELLIVNLPGYPTIPEFQHISTYNGMDLLESRKVIKIKPISTTPTPTTTTTTTPTIISSIPTPITTTSTSILKTSNRPNRSMIRKHKKKCKNGDMKCSDTGFYTCIWDKWVYRECASGTKCRSISNNIICDFI